MQSERSALLRCRAVVFGLPKAPCALQCPQMHAGDVIPSACVVPSVPSGSTRATQGALGFPPGHAGARTRNPSTFGVPRFHAVISGFPKRPAMPRRHAGAQKFKSSAFRALSRPRGSLRATQSALRCTKGHAGTRKCITSPFGAPSLPCGSLRATHGPLRCPHGHAGTRKCNPSALGVPSVPCGSCGASQPSPALPSWAHRRAEAESERLRRFFGAMRWPSAYGLPQPPCGALKGTQARGCAIRAPSALLRCHAVAFRFPRRPGVLQGHAGA